MTTFYKWFLSLSLQWNCCVRTSLLPKMCQISRPSSPFLIWSHNYRVATNVNSAAAHPEFSHNTARTQGSGGGFTVKLMKLKVQGLSLTRIPPMALEGS
jgi:hypothetical protein